ncbi:MAG: FeoB-associated Cys-rich membrane protein [Bacteroidales bacterium]|nr:FeoB-associated Cys-rich membrane protein [Bacteroidales bacterium]HPO65291.1 FeoB-associated Cys-rich membrane protein [Bacteroidales bacterium]
MDWQEIGVYIIVALAVGYTLYHIVRAFQQKAYSPGCAHCNGSCQVKPAKNSMIHAKK